MVLLIFTEYDIHLILLPWNIQFAAKPGGNEALEGGSPVSRIPEIILKSILKIIKHFQQVSPKSRNLCIPISLKFHSMFSKLSHIPLNKCTISLYP